MVKAAEMILEGGRLVKGEISSFTPQGFNVRLRKAAVGLLIGGSALLGTYGAFKLAEKNEGSRKAKRISGNPRLKLMRWGFG